MMNKDNVVFNEMKRIGHEWEEQRAAHQAKKQGIIDTFGWDSEELKNWYAEKEAHTFPFTQGQSKAYRAWAETISAASRRIVQSSDYKMKSTDEALEKKLNKEAFAVVTGDGLYVNCRNFRHQGVRFGNGYARGFRMADGKLCVINRKVGKSTLMEAGLTGGITSVVAPGVIASAIAGTGLTEVQLANQVCYLVDSDAGSNGKTKITQIGDQVIAVLLADRKDLLDKYNAAGDKRTRQSALNVFTVLREAGMLERRPASVAVVGRIR